MLDLLNLLIFNRQAQVYFILYVTWMWNIFFQLFNYWYLVPLCRFRFLIAIEKNIYGVEHTMPCRWVCPSKWCHFIEEIRLVLITLKSIPSQQEEKGSFLMFVIYTSLWVSKILCLEWSLNVSEKMDFFMTLTDKILSSVNMLYSQVVTSFC